MTRRPTISRRTGSPSALLERGGRAEWLLNYRSGAFLIPADAATARDAALNGVTTEPLDDGQAGADPGPAPERQHGRSAAGEGARRWRCMLRPTPRRGTTR